MIKLCVDLGATNIKSGLIEDYKIIKKAITPTNANGGINEIILSLKKSIDVLLCDKVKEICISSAGQIDSVNGKVIYATDNLPNFTGFDFFKFIKENYNLPCSVINDGHAALLGEIAINPEYKNKKIVMLTLGSGVGGAYAVNGKIKANEENNFALFGHVSIDENGTQCNCGKKGCIEQYLSGRAINRLALNFGIENDKIFDEYKNGNKNAIFVMEKLREYLKKSLDNINEINDFDLCIIGGGAADGMKDSFSDFTKDLGYDVIRAKAGNNAGILGAYYFSFNK